MLREPAPPSSLRATCHAPCRNQLDSPEQVPTMLGGRGREAPNGGTEHIVGIIGSLELEQARIIRSEGRRNALLFPHVQQIDVATVQRIGRQGSGGFLCPRYMLLVLFWRLRLPAGDNFDHQVILAQRKGRLGGRHAAGGSMEVMDRESR